MSALILMRSKMRAAALTALLFIGISDSPWAGAQTVFNWDPPAHMNIFSTAGNWTPAGPPGTTGEARFNTGSSGESVSFNTDPTNARMRVGNDHVIFDLNGHTYTLTTTSTSSPSIMVGGITLADDALLTIRDGTLSGQHAVIAPVTLQTAAGMIVDTGGTLNLAGTFTIGKQLPGLLMIQNGGDVTSATGVLGESGNGDGNVTVTGNGSTWSNSGSIYVGGQAASDGGNGTLSITNQGLVDIDGTLKLWPGGMVALNGGTLETASLELAGGAFNWTAGTLHLGSDLSVDPSGLFGSPVVVGAGKALETDGNLYVGNAGTGALSITNGAQVHVSSDVAEPNSATFVGFEPGSVGEVTVTGTGSAWLNDGSVFVGAEGDGTLMITNGGFVQSIFGNIAYLDGGSGSVTVAGPDSSWAIVSNPNAFLSGRLIVGQEDHGSLNITGGGSVFSVSGYIGYEINSMGEVTVDGAESTWEINGNLYVGSRFGQMGDAGSGVLQVTGGGRVSTIFTYIGGSNGSGAVIVDGAGSILATNLGLLLGSVLGDASLTVSNGGQVQTLNLLVGARGEVHGDGNIIGNVENGGVVSPGMSPGALNIDGNYTQTADGELLIELATASYDQLLIADNATLDGTLTVNFLDGYIPSPGQSFTILTADDVDGMFTTEMLPSVSGRIFDVIYNPQSVVITVSPAFTADFDEDGDVDCDDLTEWQAAYGLNSLADADFDGDSDGRDFLEWQRQYTGPAPLAASMAVPEPASATLLLGLASLSLWRTLRSGQ